MKYRVFNKTGEDISLLGFGTMRLPVIDCDPKRIDETLSINMIRAAIDKGVNYVDTAYIYHGGNSEVVLGKALQDGYREKVFIADKMPVWLLKSEADLEKIFEEQLQRLQVDCIDFYLIHSISAPSWKRTIKYNVIDFLEKKKAEGKIKHLGFSFHDELDLFKEIIDYHPWDFCQIQLNFMDTKFQAGVTGLQYAASKNIPVIIMEPLKGGKLTDVLPGSIQELWDSAPVKRSPAEWAFRWVADFPQVLTILSGMSTMEQAEENLKIFSDLSSNTLTEKEHEIIDMVAAQYNNLIRHSCTSCQYCLPCPQKIDIPTIISLYNNWYLYEGNEKIKNDFHMWTVPGRGPSICTTCRQCEGNCPQHLPISDIMKAAEEIFE